METASTIWSSLQKRAKSLPFLGHILVSFSSLFMTLGGFTIKFIDRLDPFSILLYRNIFLLIILIPLCVITKATIFPKGKIVPLLIRAICMGLAAIAVYFGFLHLPLGDARVLAVTSSVFTTIFARCFLKEPCGIFEVINIVVTTLGIVMVVQPPFLFGQHNLQLDGKIVEYGEIQLYAALATLASTASVGFGAVLTRSLKDLSINVVMLWGAVIGIIIPIIGALIQEQVLNAGFESFVPSENDCYLMLAIGVLSYLGIMFLTASYFVEEAGLMNLTRKANDVVYSYTIQVSYFGDVPNVPVLVGALIITGSTLLSGFRKVVEKKSTNERLKWWLCLPKEEQEVEEQKEVVEEEKKMVENGETEKGDVKA